MDPPHFQTSHLVRAQPPCYWYTLQTPQDLSRRKYPTFDILPEGAYSLDKACQIESVQPSLFQTKQARQNEINHSFEVRPSKSMAHIKQEDDDDDDDDDDSWPPELLKANLKVTAAAAETTSTLELDLFSKPVKPDMYLLHQSFPQSHDQGCENTKPSENNDSIQDQGNEKEKLAVSAYSDKAKIGKSFEAEWSLLQSEDTGIKYTVQGPTTEYDPDPFFDFPSSISEDNIFLTDLSPPVFSKVSKPKANPRFEVLNDDTTPIHPDSKAETKDSLVSRNSQTPSVKAPAIKSKNIKLPKARGGQLQTSRTKQSRSLHDVTNYPFFAYNVAAGSEDGVTKCRRYFDATAPPQINTQRESKTKVHRCSICHKSFKRPSSYRIHYTIHSGEKRFSCFECGRCFNVKSNLTRHERLHNKPDGFRRSKVDIKAVFAEGK
ncbi:hypothetical protein OXX69_008516 [Metschnikowia pulcherrima]